MTNSVNFLDGIPRTRDLPLMSPMFFCGSVLVYLIGVKYALPKWECNLWLLILYSSEECELILYILSLRFMLNRKPYSLKRVIFIYNIIQVLSCVVLVWKYFNAGFNLTYFYACNNPNYGHVTGTPKRMQDALWLTYLLKLFELVETFFFVLRKKDNQASFLHLYHHVSTLFCAWYFFRHIGGKYYKKPCVFTFTKNISGDAWSFVIRKNYNFFNSTDGTLLFSIVINTFIHSIMYSYYFLAALGPNVQKHLQIIKKFITKAQLVSSTTMTVHQSMRTSFYANHFSPFLDSIWINISQLLYSITKTMSWWTTNTFSVILYTEYMHAGVTVYEFLSKCL